LRLAEELGPVGKRWEPDGPEMTDYIRDQAHLFLGSRLVDSDPRAALEHFRKTGPQFKDQFSAVALRNMGDLEGAMASLAVAERFHRDKRTTHTAEDILTRATRWAGAWALHLKALLRGQPDMNLADPASAAARCREAIELLETNLKVDATDALAVVTRSQFQTTLGMLIADTDPAESVRILSEVLASGMYPGPPWPRGWMRDARWGISYPLRKLGKTHEALQQAQQSVTEAPPEVIADAHKAVADALMDLGRKEAALEEYRAAVAAAEKRASSVPKNMVVRANLARHYDALGRHFELARDWRSAREWYSKAHTLWRDWSKAGGVLNPFVSASERRLAGLVARCDAALVSAIRRN
jgi:tetratricopeptide (TPR) repeat protein